MGKGSFPTGYSITHGGAINIDMDLDNIKVKEIAPMQITADAVLDNIRVEKIAPVQITTDMGLDNIHIKELPKIVLESDSKLDMGLDKINVTVGLKPVRIHLPQTHKASISVLGRELLSFKVCGENMVVVEEYEKRKTEGCK